MCASCKVDKPDAEFHRHRRNKSGLHSYCKPCVRAKNAAWVRDNRQRHRQSCANWYANNRGKANQTQSCWHYRSSYGITKEQFVALVDSGGRKCGICGGALVIGAKTSDGAALDHCHATGAIRGVLCNACNKGLGHFADSHARLRAAANYLEGAP